MGANDRKRKQIILDKERLKSFHRWYSLLIQHSARFGRVNLVGKMEGVESLFYPEKKTKEERRRAMNIPITYSQFKHYKFLYGLTGNYPKKELRVACRKIKSMQVQQILRNSEVLVPMIEKLKVYKKELDSNRSIFKLGKSDKVIKSKIKIFRKNRIAEVKRMISDLTIVHKQVWKGTMFLNDLESYIKMYAELFTIANKKLEIFCAEIYESLNEKHDVIEKEIIAEKVNDKKYSLKLPSWDLVEANP